MQPTPSIKLQFVEDLEVLDDSFWALKLAVKKTAPNVKLHFLEDLEDAGDSSAALEIAVEHPAPSTRLHLLNILEDPSSMSMSEPDVNELLTFSTVEKLLIPATLTRLQELGVVPTEEKQRMWARRWLRHLSPFGGDNVFTRLQGRPLLRTFDVMSGSQPDEIFRMLARAPRMRLDNSSDRQQAIRQHIDHQNWDATPFISFTDSPAELTQLAEWRRAKANRGDQMVVAINPRVRFDLGLPILHCGDEMAHYGVKSPYGGDYWSKHYLCLWEVTPAEVLGVWRWEDLRGQLGWYEEILKAVAMIGRIEDDVQMARQNSVLRHQQIDAMIARKRAGKVNAA